MNIKTVVLSCILLFPTSSFAAQQTAIFAGGCFWGIEAVFEQTKGVVSARSGYAGGSADTANYIQVSRGKTGHAESVEVVFDDTKISYQQLLDIFFHVAHDPTQLNRQGPDAGTQYRSALFYTNGTQLKTAKQYIQRLNNKGAFSAPIVTQVQRLEAFYPAEDYHQDYVSKHPDQPYIVHHDRPKLERFKQSYPMLYKNNTI